MAKYRKKPTQQPSPQTYKEAIRLILGDCQEVSLDVESGSVDAIICDLPYGTTSNKWDVVIPLSWMWNMFGRVLKPKGVVVLTASQPFSSMLVMSNLDMFKHEWIWIKNRGSNFANTVREPFKEHEHVLVFSRGGWTYNKQMQPRTGAGADRVKYTFNHKSKSENYRDFDGRESVELPEMRVPSSWQKFNTDTSGLHPTIKPIDLFEYLIKTYTNEGDIVLDICMGSGTTGVAALNLKRRFIGIEKEEKYFSIASKRIYK